MITCYATPGKAKALRLCEAFAVGARACGVAADFTTDTRRLRPGAAVFYGIREDTRPLWAQCKTEGRDWYFIDNSYFDAARGWQFRVTKNRVQHDGRGQSDGARRQALGVTVKPWQMGTGRQAVICLQSDLHLRLTMAVDPALWLRQALVQAREMGLPARVRHWDANKGRQMATLADDLRGASVVITHSSAAAVEALLAGIAVRCAPQCAAHGVTPERREAWADVLADNQWTLAELADGTAWRMLNANA